MHYRQQIRDAVAAVLLNETVAGANVFTSRSRPVLEILQRREAVLSVYTADEQSTRDGTGYLLDRQLTVTVEGMMGGGDDLDDSLDDLAAEVEALLEVDPSLGNLLSEDLVLDSTATEISARGNMQVGAFRLDFSCAYQTQRKANGYLPGDEPGVEIPDVPVPTELNTSFYPDSAAYGSPNQDLTLKPAVPVEPVESVCANGSCDIPAWQGDQ